MSSKTEVIEIKAAKYLPDYKIRLQFNDGLSKTIDFEKFLKNAGNPMVRKYLNKELFKKYKVEYGDLMWGDYEMCFPMWDLYEGKI